MNFFEKIMELASQGYGISIHNDIPDKTTIIEMELVLYNKEAVKRSVKLGLSELGLFRENKEGVMVKVLEKIQRDFNQDLKRTFRQTQRLFPQSEDEVSWEKEINRSIEKPKVDPDAFCQSAWDMIKKKTNHKIAQLLIGASEQGINIEINRVHNEGVIYMNKPSWRRKKQIHFSALVNLVEDDPALYDLIKTTLSTGLLEEMPNHRVSKPNEPRDEETLINEINTREFCIKASTPGQSCLYPNCQCREDFEREQFNPQDYENLH